MSSVTRHLTPDTLAPLLAEFLRRSFQPQVRTDCPARVEHEEEQLMEEWERLNQLLSPEDRPATCAGLRQAIRRRTELYLCIRQDEADAGPYRKQVLAHVRESVREKLLVNNPGWIARPES